MLLSLAVVVAVTLLFAAPALAGVITNSSDNLRDGWYPEQSSLTPQLVSGGTFGQLWSAPVEGQVYGQPLLDGETLLVATEANKVYGLNPATGAQRWSPLSLGTPWNPNDIHCGDLTPNIGVTSTPVIDTSTNTAYMTHKTYVSGSSGPARWYMDAIEMATGREKAGWPVELSGTAQNAPGQTFHPTTQMQRPGLLLNNGVVYAGFGSHCDIAPWQGWVFGVSTTEARMTARWVSLASGEEGAGIWQSGSGLFSDGPGTLLVATGNIGAPPTPAPGNSPPTSLGESIVRLNVQADGSLKAVNFFAPSDAQTLDSWDADFASGGVTGLDERYFGTSAIPHLAVAVGKDGYVYLLNRDELGGFQQGAGGGDKVVQRIGPYGGVWSRPGVWPGEGGWVYIPTASGGETAGGSSGFLNVFQYGVSGSGEPTLSLQATSSDAFGFGSSAPVITSVGTNPGTALVWMTWMTNGSGTEAQLRAYDPVPVGGHPVLRWSAPIGTASKFAMPGVGAGRIYVGTRDGHVLGFGSPVAQPLTGPATSFPNTTIGSSSQETVTLTATGTVTVNGLSSSSSQFTVGTPTPALPAHLTAGQTIQVPLTFTPSKTGLQSATLTAETDKGNLGFGMSGSGQSVAPQLTSSPSVVSFGGTSVGGHSTGTATFRNVGGSPLTITAVRLPAAPFGATGLPEVGSTIASGGSVTVNLTFDPTAIGTYSDQLVIESTGGTASVGVSGSAGSPGVLTISSETNEYGSVVVGKTKKKSFTITNTGASAVTITKSKPPSGGAFAATTTLSEGTTLAPGASRTETVTYAPSAPGYASAVWTINGDDLTGLHQVTFTGAGTVPAPGSSWQANGAATIASGAITTTPAVAQSAGSAFFKTPLESRHLVVEFTESMKSGTGADGETLALADASAAAPTALGSAGSGLGFAGIHGVAVALDTYQNPGDPSNNFVGVTQGTGAEPLSWLATNGSIPNLRQTARRVKVEVNEGTVTVWIEGTQVLSTFAEVPGRVLLGFTGATGQLTDIHKVTKIAIGGEPPPSTSSLKLGVNIEAPAGSPQAETAVSFSGACPSSFSTATIADGGFSTPALTGAVTGASCSVSETAPTASGWSVSASVNGATPIPLTASGGEYTVPSFALTTGVNTVQFTNTYTTGTAVPDPTAGGWQFNGTAKLSGSELVLTEPAEYQAGSAFWPTAVNPSKLNIEFTASIGGGTGADGLALVLADPSRGATPTSLGAAGGGLGFSGTPGIAFALDEYQNEVNPSSDFTGITDGPTSKSQDEMHWIATANLTAPIQNASHRVRIQTSGGVATVYIDGTQVLSHAVTLPASAYLGFSAGTGGLNNRHAISNLIVTAG
jgi:iron transport multicopper oxidase